jgi:hypothetical protein
MRDARETPQRVVCLNEDMDQQLRCVNAFRRHSRWGGPGEDLGRVLLRCQHRIRGVQILRAPGRNRRSCARIVECFRVVGEEHLCCYGDNAEIVPLSPGGAGPRRTIWAGQPAVDLVSSRAGGDPAGGWGASGSVTARMATTGTLKPSLSDFTTVAVVVARRRRAARADGHVIPQGLPSRNSSCSGPAVVRVAGGWWGCQVVAGPGRFRGR